MIDQVVAFATVQPPPFSSIDQPHPSPDGVSLSLSLSPLLSQSTSLSDGRRRCRRWAPPAPRRRGLLDGLPSTVTCVVFSSDGAHYHHEGRFYGQPAHGKNTWDDEAQAKQAMAIFLAHRVKARTTRAPFFFNDCLLARATPPAMRPPHPTARTSLAQAPVHQVHPHRVNLLDHRGAALLDREELLSLLSLLSLSLLSLPLLSLSLLSLSLLEQLLEQLLAIARADRLEQGGGDEAAWEGKRKLQLLGKERESCEQGKRIEALDEHVLGQTRGRQYDHQADVLLVLDHPHASSFSPRGGCELRAAAAVPGAAVQAHGKVARRAPRHRSRLGQHQVVARLRHARRARPQPDRRLASAEKRARLMASPCWPP